MRLPDAINAYNKVLQYDPKNFNAAYSQGLLFEALKQPADAEKACADSGSVCQDLPIQSIQISTGTDKSAAQAPNRGTTTGTSSGDGSGNGTDPNEGT